MHLCTSDSCRWAALRYLESNKKCWGVFFDRQSAPRLAWFFFIFIYFLYGPCTKCINRIKDTHTQTHKHECDVTMVKVNSESTNCIVFFAFGQHILDCGGHSSLGMVLAIPVSQSRGTAPHHISISTSRALINLRTNLLHPGDPANKELLNYYQLIHNGRVIHLISHLMICQSCFWGILFCWRWG